MVWAGLFALGIGFGVLVTGHGLPWWLAPVISSVVFAGSLEFLLVGMIAAAAPLVSIAVTTLLVNSRHLFYGLTFPLHRVRGRTRKAYSVYALCDEAYALLTARDPATLSSRHVLFTQLGLHAGWALGALTGSVVGATVLGGLKGLDFVLTALFVVLTLDAYRDRPDARTLALAVVCAAVALALATVAGHGAVLPLAMGAFTACLLVRHRAVRGEHPAASPEEGRGA